MFLALFCAAIICVPLLIVSFLYDVVPYDLAVALAPFPLALICVAISLFPTIRFKKMIAEQESLYNTVFSDTDAEHLETTLYISRDWLIWAGCSAIFKAHILSVQSRYESGRAGASNRVTITTADHRRYVVWCLRAEMFAAFAIGADAETVPPSFLAFLSFRKEKQANESQLPEGYSSAARPCQRAAQNGRFPYEPPVFSCNASCAGGKRPAVKTPPLPAVPFVSFLQGKNTP